MNSKPLKNPLTELEAIGKMERFLHTSFGFLGRVVIDWVNHLGASVIFLSKALVMVFKPKGVGEIVNQIYFIGARSSGIVMMVGLFTGMVLGLQMFYALVKYGSESALGSAVALALVRELGPVLTGIMIAARAGSAMTAEIGIQRISEQIDALYTMGIDPVKYLVSPRIWASIISFPLLTAFFDLIGLIGGYLTGVVILGVNEGAYFYRVQMSIEMMDITGGFIKALVFSIIVSTICCYQGYFCHMRRDGYGAKSVGLATTSAVVLSCVMILVADYVVTSLLM
jgi:phospholipid/cholesterol/gamma-HCH transport system permease protein